MLIFLYLVCDTVKDMNYDGDIDASEEEDNALKTATAYVVGTKTKTDETYNAPNAWITEDTWNMAESGDYEGTVVYASKLVETDT